MSKIAQLVNDRIYVLRRLVPILSFIIPILTLYYIHPKSFEGDPTWEGNWQGRFFYFFFLWLALLEIISGWERPEASRPWRIRSKRTIVLALFLLLPTVYVMATQFYGLNSAIIDFARINGVPNALLMPLTVEYLVFAALFAVIILLSFGIRGLADFSIPTVFLMAIGALYAVDILYPGGTFTPFQILVPATATLSMGLLNALGYSATMELTTHPYYGSTPRLMVEDSMGRRACPFSIAWPCAGVESLIIFTLTILLFLKRSAIPMKQRAVYFIFGALVTYFINIVRIATIFVISIPCGSTMDEVWRFHNIYGQLFSISWIIAYPWIIIATRLLWKKILLKRAARDTGTNPLQSS